MRRGCHSAARRRTRRDRALRRARSALRSILTPKEYAHVTQHGFLDVPSPSRADRIYRIARNGGLVWVYERGHPVEWLCMRPEDALPADDILIAHRLYIDAREDEYLATATHIPHGPYGDLILSAMGSILGVPWEPPLRDPPATSRWAHSPCRKHGQRTPRR